MEMHSLHIGSVRSFPGSPTQVHGQKGQSCSDCVTEVSFSLQALHMGHVPLDHDQPHGCFSWQTWQAFPPPAGRMHGRDGSMALTVFPLCRRGYCQGTSAEACAFTLPPPPATGIYLMPAGLGSPGNPGLLLLQDEGSFLPVVSSSPDAQQALTVLLLHRAEHSKNPDTS